MRDVLQLWRRDSAPDESKLWLLRMDGDGDGGAGPDGIGALSRFGILLLSLSEETSLPVSSANHTHTHKTSMFYIRLKPNYICCGLRGLSRGRKCVFRLRRSKTRGG